MKNKKNRLLFILSCTLLLTMPLHYAHTEDLSYYIGTQYNIPGKIYTHLEGPSSAKQSFPNIDITAGAKLHHFRVEFSPGYRSFKYDNTIIGRYSSSQHKINRLDLYKFMFNGYVDGPKFYDLFTPYIVGGIGYARIIKRNLNLTVVDLNDLSTDTTSTTTSGNNFAWQSGVGLSTALTNHFSMDVGVVYASYGRVKFAEPSPIAPTKLKDIEAFVGFRYLF